MVRPAQHHERPALSQSDNKVGTPGHGMGMDDQRWDIVERHPALFLAITRDDQETKVGGKMKSIRRNIDDAIHGSIRDVSDRA